jgi:tRNA(Ile)-lysidine synthase
MPGGRPPAVARVLERVVRTSRRHDLFRPDDTVIVACSGGPDSTCLLHALHRLRRLFRIRLVAFHFDHRLRPGSERDAVYAERQARSLRIPFVARRAVGEPGRGESVEAWARLARYAALTSAATDEGADRTALGHTEDDQAETVLLGLARGGGLDAVAGMAPLGSIPPLGFPAVRPLLDVTRSEVSAFNRSLRLRPRQDPSNRDPRFLRNKVRLDVLPFLERRLGRGLRVTLARTADHVREDAEFLESVASEAATRVVEVGEDEVRLDAAALDALPGPIAARVVRQALRLASATASRWEPDAAAAHIDGVLDLAAGRPGRRLDLPGDLEAARAREYVRVSRPSPGRTSRKGDR